MWYTILLACGSSTDNFAVGASVGISNKPLRTSANALISLLNALGAYISAAGGHLLGELAPLYATTFAALIFAYLSVDEFISCREVHSKSAETNSTLSMKSSSASDALRIAVPMTLNNLAGGAAGGAAGIDANTAGVTALLASFVMMKLGHVTGQYLKQSLIGKRIHTNFISGCIFGCLSAMQLLQLLH